MLTIMYERLNNGIYVSHIDVLRALNRTFRRAGIEVAYSQGFNRHMLVNMTQPLPFGIASTQDWVSFENIKRYDCREVLEKFNANCPDYMRGVYCKETVKNPSLSAKINCCSYIISSTNAMKRKEEIENLKKGLVLEYEKKGEKLVKDVTDCIYDIKVKENTIECLLSFGVKNLRIDLLSEHLNKVFDLGIKFSDIVRNGQYIFEDGIFVNSKKYVEGLE